MNRETAFNISKQTNGSLAREVRPAGRGQLEEPEAKANPEPEIGTREDPNRRPPMLSTSSQPPTWGQSLRQLGQQQLLSRNETELRGDGYHDGWTTTVWRIIAGFLLPGNYLLIIAARLFLQKKHLTFTGYETIDAEEQQATTKPGLCPVLVPLQSLGPGKGAPPRAPFTLTGLGLPDSEEPISTRASTLRVKVGRSIEAKDRTQGQTALQQDQDQGVGQLEEPRAKATTEPEIDSWRRPTGGPPHSALAYHLPPGAQASNRGGSSGCSAGTRPS